MSKSGDKNNFFSMRMNKDREKLFENLENNLLHKIDKESRTALVEESMKITLRFLEYLEEEEENQKRLEKVLEG